MSDTHSHHESTLKACIDKRAQFHRAHYSWTCTFLDKPPCEFHRDALATYHILKRQIRRDPVFVKEVLECIDTDEIDQMWFHQRYITQLSDCLMQTPKKI